MKSIVQSGLINVGAHVKENLTELNGFFTCSYNLTSLSFFNISFISLRCSSRLGMNLLKNFIFPLKDWIFFLFLRKSNYWIASILEGSMWIPSFEIIFPSNFPSSMENKLFLGFNKMPNFLHFWNTILKWFKCSSSDYEKIATSSR